MLEERRLNLWRQLTAQAVHLNDPLGHICRRALDNQAGQADRLTNRIQHREHSAPRMPKDMDLTEPKCVPHRIHFSHVELRCPQPRVVRLSYRRVTTAELVVEHDPPTFGERLIRLHVVPARSGPTVEAEHR